ncbi:ImmA/IrrE family metallo-endopeptidase [Qipengyuania sp. DSG2-2]|uniref:ImmA/IrrE family metallo-endopeptidase n=1 Tax=Qipengyuania sp. DGS2-2 TaxID=3349631 RepID=UPI0036D40227
MNIDRMDLDGVGSPTGLAARIHELLPDLPLPVPLEELCKRLDITSISELGTEAFEAALITDEHKSQGAILHARGRHAARTRFSIAHELGHFLIPSHRPMPSELAGCSDEHLRQADSKTKNKRRRIEAEANRFAAHLLMPPKRVRLEILKSNDDLQAIVAMASRFGVSKEAMARCWVEQHSEPVAIVMTRHSNIARYYRSSGFPWLARRFGEPVPDDSIAADAMDGPGRYSEIEEIEPDVWMDENDTGPIASLTEQVLSQRGGYSMVLLIAELDEE